MKTLNEIRQQLEKEYPVLTEMTNDVETELTSQERSERLDLWAEKMHQVEIETAEKIAKEQAKISALEKLASLGLTEAEANSLIK